MKKITAVVLSVIMLLSLGACAGAETGTGAAALESTQEEKTNEDSQTQETAVTPDGNWNIPETTEMTEEVTDLFHKAVEGLMGVSYEPVGCLGEKEGVYCILCRAAVVYPNAKPYYSLVYVSDEGIQNIWDIWMDMHAEKKK